jgi:hypothetical protein
MTGATEDFHDNAKSNTGSVYGRAVVPDSVVPAARVSDHADPIVQSSFAVPVHESPVPSAAAPRYDLRPPNGQARQSGGPGEDTDGEQRSRRPRRRLVATAVAVVVVTLFATGAVGYSLLQPTVYGAQAELVLAPRAELSDAAVDRAMATQMMIAQSDPVLGRVANQAGMSLRRLRREVSVDLVGRSNILRLTVGDRSRERALSLARLTTNEYLKVATTAVNPAGPGAVGNPGATRGPVTGTGGDDRPPITPILLSPASPLEAPLQPKPLRALAAGALLGLIVAAAAVIVLLRPRVLSPPSRHWT